MPVPWPPASPLQCLVGADGSALLHRVSRLNDPDITEQVGSCLTLGIVLVLAAGQQRMFVMLLLWRHCIHQPSQPHQGHRNDICDQLHPAGRLCRRRCETSALPSMTRMPAPTAPSRCTRQQAGGRRAQGRACASRCVERENREIFHLVLLLARKLKGPELRGKPVPQLLRHSLPVACFLPLSNAGELSGRAIIPCPCCHQTPHDNPLVALLPFPCKQEGAVDEVSFRAPELGPLAALLVGPEAGCWVCEEVDVSSSRTGHTDR